MRESSEGTKRIVLGWQRWGQIGVVCGRLGAVMLAAAAAAKRSPAISAACTFISFALSLGTGALPVTFTRIAAMRGSSLLAAALVVGLLVLRRCFVPPANHRWWNIDWDDGVVVDGDLDVDLPHRVARFASPCDVDLIHVVIEAPGDAVRRPGPTRWRTFMVVLTITA